MSEVVLRLERVTVPGRVRDVSLTVAPGQVHGVVGPNGSGKSTVLQAVLGLEAHEGEIVVAEGRVGLVPQKFAHDGAWSLTVGDFLALSRTRWPVALGVPRAVRDHVESLLASAGAAQVRDRLISELSGGELRRVLVLNAVDPAPALLLLDEPETGLDAAGLTWLDATLGDLKRRGVAMVLVSHDGERVGRLADSVTRLVAGAVEGRA